MSMASTDDLLLFHNGPRVTTTIRSEYVPRVYIKLKRVQKAEINELTLRLQSGNRH